MANGANRLFGVIKNTSEDVQPIQTAYITLTVKSLNPFILQVDDRLDITEDFCQFSEFVDKQAIQVGHILAAIVLNNGQLYYIVQNLDVASYASKKILYGTSQPSSSLGNDGDVYLQY